MMNSIDWKQKVHKLVEAIPSGQEFTPRNISDMFNSRGPTPNDVGRYLRASGLATRVKTSTGIMSGSVWRRN